MKDSKCHSKFTLGHFRMQVNILKKANFLLAQFFWETFFKLSS